MSECSTVRKLGVADYHLYDEAKLLEVEKSLTRYITGSIVAQNTVY